MYINRSGWQYKHHLNSDVNAITIIIFPASVASVSAHHDGCGRVVLRPPRMYDAMLYSPNTTANLVVRPHPH